MIRYVVDLTIRAKIVGTGNCDLARGSFLPEDHERRIDCDSRQPSREAGPAVKVIKVNKRSQQCVLNRVFGIFTISSDAIGRAQELRSMELVALAKANDCPDLAAFTRFLSADS